MSDMEKLKAVSLFRGLSEAMLLEFCGYFKETSYGAGAVVFRERTEGDSLYIIVEGEVTIEKAMDEADREFKTLAILAAGDFFGEMAVLENQTRFAQARASKDSSLYEISRDKFFAFIKDHPETGITIFSAIMRTMLRRLKHTSNELTMLFDLSRQLMAEHKSPAGFMAAVMDEMRPYLEGQWNIDAYIYNMFNEEFESAYTYAAFQQEDTERKLPSRPENGWLNDKTYLMTCATGGRLLACAMFSRPEAATELEKNNLATIFNTISSIIGSAMVNIEHQAEAAMLAKLKQAKI